MKSVAVAFALVLALAVPAAAQDRPVDFTIWGTWVDMQGSTTFEDGLETEFDSGEGLGISTNIFVTDRLSAEVAVFALTSDAFLNFEDFDQLELGAVDLVPVTAGLQYHFLGSSRFDPYVGGGAAYVMAEELESDDLDGVGLGTIELDDEFTWFVQAGLGFQFTDHFGLALDARYIPYEPGTESSVTGGEEDLEITPLLASVGLRFRF
jgi:outer membrane protein W